MRSHATNVPTRSRDWVAFCAVVSAARRLAKANDRRAGGREHLTLAERDALAVLADRVDAYNSLTRYAHEPRRHRPPLGVRVRRWLRGG